MRFKKIALAIAAGTTLIAAAPAFAHPPHWAPAYGWRAGHHRHHYRPQQVVVVPPAPYYYYAPPPPAFVYPKSTAPSWHVSIGLRL